jgi:hypothetical protein
MIVLVEKLKVQRLFVAVAIVGKIVMVPVIVGEMAGLVVEIDLLVAIAAHMH